MTREVQKKVYANVGALGRPNQSTPFKIVIKVFKAYIFPHLQYLSRLLMAIGKTFIKKTWNLNTVGGTDRGGHKK